MAFRGSTQLALDGKGRLAIPARYRERLATQCGGHLMLTADPTNGCLLLYPFPEFEALERQINSLPGFHPLTQQLKFVVVGSAEEVEPDSAGRILIPPLLRKFATAKRYMPRPVIEGDGKAKAAIVSLGSCDGAVREALDVIGARGVHLDYMRVRAFPFSEEVEKFLADHETIYVVEQNRDAQLKSLLTLETRVEKSKLRSLLHYSGLPVSSKFIVDGVLGDLLEGRRAVAGALS